MYAFRWVVKNGSGEIVVLNNKVYYHIEFIGRNAEQYINEYTMHSIINKGLISNAYLKTGRVALTADKAKTQSIPMLGVYNCI